jgi:CheY-like chemotaxis protein
MRGTLALEPRAAASTSRSRILVVDDDPTVRRLLADLLELRGYHVQVAWDGDEGLAAFREAPFDCVITDWLMPRKGGLELARAVKILNPMVPVIVCSASLDPSYFEQYAKDGTIDGFLPKPFSPQAIFDLIQKALGYKD